jgi:hypothetical protein
MASKTIKTETKRRAKLKKAGHKRKANNENHGTTKPRKELFGD